MKSSVPPIPMLHPDIEIEDENNDRSKFEGTSQSDDESEHDIPSEAESISDHESNLQESIILKSSAPALNITKRIFPNSDTKASQLVKRTVKQHVSSDRLRALTYNIWSDDKDRVDRTMQIIHLIRHQKYEIIGLQEVVPETYQLLLSHLQNHYHIFQVFISESLPYGDCILLLKDKITIVEPYYYDYDETSMSRKLICCEAKYNEMTFHIFNTHLESGQVNQVLRQRQFQTIEKAIVEYHVKNVIVLGDFNITNLQEPVENQICASVLHDVWVELGCPEDIKYTYDYQKNNRIKSQYRARTDRILYQFQCDYLVSGLKLIGLNNDRPAPSDHFGVVATFILRKN